MTAMRPSSPIAITGTNTFAPSSLAFASEASAFSTTTYVSQGVAAVTQDCRSFQRKFPRPQPSLGIPVTPANRECLRALRAAEADAWEAATPTFPSQALRR
jgi:hypothetical protein